MTAAVKRLTEQVHRSTTTASVTPPSVPATTNAVISPWQTESDRALALPLLPAATSSNAVDIAPADQVDRTLPSEPHDRANQAPTRSDARVTNDGETTSGRLREADLRSKRSKAPQKRLIEADELLAQHWLDCAHPAFPTAGTIGVLGGAIKSLDVFEAMYEHARHAKGAPPKPRLAVVASSKADLAHALHDYFVDDYKDGRLEGEALGRTFAERGFEPFFVPVAPDNTAAAYDPAIAAEVANAQAVYFCGGAQHRHAISLIDTSGAESPVAKAVFEVAAKGGLVSGSSAGAHALGSIMYGEGATYNYLKDNRLEACPPGQTLPSAQTRDIDAPGPLEAGLGFLGPLGVLTCTHFDARKRLWRLLVGLRETDRVRGVTDRAQRTLGIGADEDTGLFIKDNIGVVAGSNSVFIVDTRDAEFGHGKHFSVKGVRLSVLSSGDSYDFDKHQVISPKPVADSDERPYDSKNLLRRYELTYMIEALVRSQSTYAKGETDENDPRFYVTLTKDSKTRCFDDGHRVCVADLIVDVDY
jgi:cyanophycinase-like exopeptidase